MVHAEHSLSRNYLRVVLGFLLLQFVLHLYAKDGLYARLGIKDESFAAEPGAEDFMTYQVHALLTWIGLVSIGLFSSNLDAAAVVAVISQILCLGALFLPNGFLTSKYFHSVPVVIAPMVIQIAFGLFALFRDGNLRLRTGRAESSPYLDVAVTLALSLQALLGLALCFNYGGFLSGLQRGSSDLLQPAIHAYGEFSGWQLVVAAISVGLFYLSVDSGETRAVIAGLLVVLYFRSISLVDELQLIHVEPTQATVYSVFGIISLLVGIRLTLGTPFWEEGGLFQLRNAVLVLLLIATGLWYQMTFHYAHFLTTWMPTERAAKFLTGPCEDLASYASLLTASVYFSIWSAWATADRAACRASLLATLLSVVLQTAVYLARSHAVGFDNAGLIKLVALQGTIFLIAFKALSDDLDTHWGTWLRSLFTWSYAPIKGGLYLHVIYRTVWGLLFLFVSPMSHFAVPVLSAAEGTSPWQTDEVHLMHQYVGVHMLAGAATVYLLTRVADRPFAHAQLWATLAFYMASASFTATVRNNPTSGLTAPGLTDGIMAATVVLASFATLYWDFWHGAGDQRRLAATSRKAATSPPPPVADDAAAAASSARAPTTPTSARRGRPRKVVVVE